MAEIEPPVSRVTPLTLTPAIPRATPPPRPLLPRRRRRPPPQVRPAPARRRRSQGLTGSSRLRPAAPLAGSAAVPPLLGSADQPTLFLPAAGRLSSLEAWTPALPRRVADDSRQQTREMKRNSQIVPLFQKQASKKIASSSTPLVVDDEEIEDGGLLYKTTSTFTPTTKCKATKKIADAKLAKDFQAVLKEFQKAQRLAVEREAAYAPFITQAGLPQSYNSTEVNNGADRLAEQRTQLLESRRQELSFLDNEIVFNEAVIEERDQGIKEIQDQISEVNEIFKDLAVLVHDQGAMIDDIDSHIDNSVAATAQAKGQLSKAAKTQKSNSSLICLLMVIFGVVLLIVIIVLAA
ncbi:hypothetical protein ACQ4PT_015006 [Festuca glaucescens]